MKVLLGHPMADKQTGEYVKRGFEALPDVEVVGVHDSFLEAPEKLITMMDELKPDLVFTAKVNSYNNIASIIRSRSLLSFWSYDVRDDINIWLEDTKELYQNAHFFFTIGKSDVEKYKQAGLHNAYWLPEGIDPTIHCKPPKFTMKDHVAYECDVSFCGSLGTIHDGSGRIALIEALKKESFKFEHFSNVFNLEHSKMVNFAKVNIGNSGWPNVECSMSARDYRIMGAGGFLLTNHVNGIEDWFEIGKMCETYHTSTECIEKIKYYLEHVEEAHAMGVYARKVMHEKHKFSNRLQQVVDIAERY